LEVPMLRRLLSQRVSPRPSAEVGLAPLRQLMRWRTSATALARRLPVWLVAVVGLAARAPSDGGGSAETSPTDWVAVAPRSGPEIVQFIKQLPQDPNPLGVRAAHQRTKALPPTFKAVRFPSVDGTPLAGILALGLDADTTPRPGVVLVPGFTQTTSHKYIV